MNILDTIFPRWCIGCGRKLLTGERYLCLHCLAELPRTSLWLEPETNKLAESYYPLPFVKRVAAYIKYVREGQSSHIVKTFKYRSQRELALYCGKMMAEEMGAKGLFHDIDYLIPVPLTFRRHLWRGYNQSEYLAKGISKTTKIPVCTSLLKRTHFKESQTTKAAWERQENVRHAFKVNKKEAESFRGRHLMLVDDVITAGATTRACCEALSKIPDVMVSIVSFATAHHK